MIGVLYVVAVEKIRVSHDGRRDPRWNEKLDYTSRDDGFEDSTIHGKEMIELKAQNFQSTIAEHQNDRMRVPREGLGGRLEECPVHVDCCRVVR